MRLDDLSLSTPAYHCLVRDEKLVTVADLLRMSEKELMRLPNFGKHTLFELHSLMAELGLQLFVLPEPMLNDLEFIAQDFTWLAAGPEGQLAFHRAGYDRRRKPPAGTARPDRPRRIPSRPPGRSAGIRKPRASGVGQPSR